MNNNKSNAIYAYVLEQALKLQTSSVLLSISEGRKDKEELAEYTTFLGMIALKAFDNFIKTNTNLKDKKKAADDYTRMYIELEQEAYRNPSILDGKASFYENIKDYSSDIQLYIFAILTLGTTYKNNSINKIKNIIRTYPTKVKRVNKNSSNYLNYFKSTYTDVQAKSTLLLFLVENS